MFKQLGYTINRTAAQQLKNGTAVTNLQPGDLVITQDYGLASMCLAKGAKVLHQDGWEYTAYNIEALLFQRHASREYRASGGRIKGPAKRKNTQNQAFSDALRHFLESERR